MKRQFIETEINDFRGIATGKRLRAKNDATELLNFDLRETTGDLVLRDGYQQKYAAPSNVRLTNLSILAGENFYVQDYGGGREVTVLVGKATLNRETGSGISPSTLNIPVIFIRPFWESLDFGTIQAGSTTTVIKSNLTTTADQYKDCYLRISTTNAVPSSSNSGNFRKIISHTTGVNAEFTIDTLPYSPVATYVFEIFGWSDVWQWLNEMIYTRITGIYGADQATPILNYAFGNGNELVNWVITNITKNEHSTILFNDAYGIDDKIGVADCNNSWDADDVVLLQKNHIPLEYLYSLYNITAADINFYSILNELRLAFGGQPKRLAFAIGMRDKSFQLSTLPGAYPAITGQVYQSILSARQEIMLDPINTTCETGTYAAVFADYGTGTFPNKKYFYRVTAFLDDHSEFLILEGSHTVAINKQIELNLYLAATYNKRITAFRLWLSEGVGTSDTVATNPYYLIRDIEATQRDLDYTKNNWIYDNDGLLGNLFTIYIDYPDFTNNLGEMQSLLGYAPTMDYANSFDQGSVIGKTVYAVNPCSDIRWNNLIYYSPESGEAVFQYDVLTASNYHAAEQFDKNDIVGIGLLNNMDFAVLKRNVYNQMDKDSGITYQTHYEKGVVSRRSIVNTGNGLLWSGENDIIIANTQQLVEVSEGTIRDQYRSLTSAQKESIIAAREEKDNAYRFFTGDTTNKTEFVFTNRGFIKRKQTLYPEGYIQARDGSIWFINGNKVYYEVPGFRLDVGAGIPFKWKNIFDISLLGGSIKSTDLFLVDKIWIRYSTKNTALNFDVNLYLDESTIAFDTLNCRYNQTYEQKKIIPGANAKVIELELSGTTVLNTDNLEVYALGIIWTPIKAGIYATT